MATDRPILSVKDLSVDFTTEEGLVHAVSHVGFDLFPGKTHGLVGESGSGKSVTALAMMRLLSRSASRVRSGKIIFTLPGRGDTNLLELSAREMQHVRGNHLSMVFQEPMTSLNPVQRCGHQLTEVLLWHRKATRHQADQMAFHLFGEVRLPEPGRIMRAWPHELSGGQKQRVMIAMAMACRPSVLIADEPTTALDVTVQKSILTLMQQLREQHQMAVLFISHDLGVIREVADTASVMQNGEVTETGEIHSLFSKPRHPYTKALIACRPSLHARPEKLATVNDFLTETHKKQSGGVIKASSGPHPWQHHDKKAPPILEVHKLHTHFVTKRSFWGKPKAYHKAVEDISFEVYPGETLGLVGESGCGKTTLGRSIMRLIDSRSGQVIYRGKNLATMSRSDLRKLRPKFQIIFQDPYASLTPGISIGKAIMEPMQVHGVLPSNKARKEHIIMLLEKVGLKEAHYYRYPHEFSGGQRQRVAIARALALNPEFLVCDESVSALDVSVQAQVLNLLNELKTAFGLTYVFISHDLSVVKYMSDRIMVMQEGRMAELADADTLYANPGSQHTRELIKAIPG